MQLVRQALHVKSARIINLYSQSYSSPLVCGSKYIYPHIFTIICFMLCQIFLQNLAAFLVSKNILLLYVTREDSLQNISFA
jgi:hypothetical protein